MDQFQGPSTGRESLFENERTAELDALAAWASRSADGSLADLAEEPSPDVWDAVAAESDLCARLKCPHFDRCFVFQARRRAAEADVVVVNHHLLASDLAVRLASDNWLDAAVLPPSRRLILDEAHHLEDVAAQHLGAQVSMQGGYRLLARLARNGRGLLPTLGGGLAGRFRVTELPAGGGVGRGGRGLGGGGAAEAPEGGELSENTLHPPEVVEPPSVDAKGTELGSDWLREVFAAVGEFDALRKAISDLKPRINALLPQKGGKKLLRTHDRLVSALDDARRFLRYAKPYVVCVYCHDKMPVKANCQCCGGDGWMTEDQYRQSPQGKAEKK